MNMHHVDLNIHTYCTLYKFGEKMIPTVTLYSITYKYHDFMVRQSFDTLYIIKMLNIGDIIH